MIIQRDLLEKIKPFLNRQEYISITGPRQTGKTTFLGLLKDCLVNDLKVDKGAVHNVTFEDRKLLIQFEAEPVSFVRSYCPLAPGKIQYLMIDEFQYAEEGGQKLKLIYDTMKDIKIIITGSSSLDIKAQVGKYMVGRILAFNIYPFSFGEFLRAKDARAERIYRQKTAEVIAWLFEDREAAREKGEDAFAGELNSHYEEFCVWGGYPAVVLCADRNERHKVLNDLYSNYILKDIKGLLELATEKELLSLSRILAAQAGSLVSYQGLSQATGLDYRQLKKHLNILQETFITGEIRPFFRNRQKELTKNPKIYFLDPGFRNNLMENMNGLEKRPDSGAVAENAVFIRLNGLRGDGDRINFWRTKAGAEVDFIFHLKGKEIPVEVKFSRFEGAKISRSYASFISSYDPAKGIILTKNYRGLEKRGSTEIAFVPACFF